MGDLGFQQVLLNIRTFLGHFEERSTFVQTADQVSRQAIYELNGHHPFTSDDKP